MNEKKNLMSETEINLSKVLFGGAAAYLLYVGLTCPCRPALYSCHLTQLYLAIAVLAIVLVYYNGCRVKSWWPAKQ